MSKSHFLFSSESVTEGHPDKIADQISDGILDAIYAQDPHGRVACETMVTTWVVMVAGEITTSATVDIPRTVRETIRDMGYVDARFGFDCDTCAVLTSIDEQSPDIAMGVSESLSSHKEQGAGDQGSMFGFACRETPELMPLPIMLAHRLARQLARVRKDKTIPYLRPDGKSQVTVEYREGRPVHVDTVVVAAQHDDEVDMDTLREELIEKVIFPIIPEELRNERPTRYHINPTGRFVIGGPHADCGLTGRKIIVDTYGGYSRHGGGCFSGKDPTKVDRSGSYMARHVAKNIVAAGLADKCEVQLAYAIGMPDPVSVLIEDFGTGRVDPQKLAKAVREVFPLKAGELVHHLELLRPIYRQTAVYGHFGREEPNFTWELNDEVEDLRTAVGSWG